MRITGPAAATEYKNRHQTHWVQEGDSILAELIADGYIEWDSATDQFYPSGLFIHEGTMQ